MTILQEIQQQLAPQLESLNNLIHDQLLSSNTLMNQVIGTYLRTKGKQIRPVVVLLSAGMTGNFNHKVIEAAAAADLLHNASLIHDDVVDQSKMRRNCPTINSVWDNHIAVLVGDYFLSSAMHQAISTADVRIIDALSFLGKTLSLGEIDQIYNARYHTLNEEAYFHIINYKTASLFVACARMGCYAVNAPDRQIQKLARFAELFGLCFQLRDDIFDYYTSSDNIVGKPTGNDLREGKITLPLLHALNQKDNPLSPQMTELAHQPDLTDDQIATLIEFAHKSGGIEYTFQVMHKLRDEALQIISQLPQNQYSKAFINLFDYIIARDH